MTRIVGIGDIHEHAGPRNTDRLAALDQIISEGCQVKELGAWALAGDLFHQKSTTDGRNALDERIQRMAAVAPVLIVRGNHDEVGELPGFARLKAGWPVYVFEQPHVAVIRLATGQMAGVFALPYPTRSGLVSAGIAPADVVDTAAALLDPIFMMAADQLQAARDAGYVTFMLAHANIVGSISSSGQPQWGREIEVSSGHLSRLGPILKLFGHIHKPQEISGAIYLGSVCRLDYAEIEEKRYVVADVAEDSSYTYVSHPIDVAPMFHVNGELTRDGFFLGQDAPLCPICDGIGTDGDALEYTDVAPPCPSCHGTGRRAIWEDCDVRVRYSYRASEKAVLNEQIIHDQFKAALRLKVEGVVIADREIRSPEVAAAKTLPEKVAAYRKVAALEASVADKLAALEQQDPTVLLAHVSAALVAIERPQDVTVAA